MPLYDENFLKVPEQSCQLYKINVGRSFHSSYPSLLSVLLFDEDGSTLGKFSY